MLISSVGKLNFNRVEYVKSVSRANYISFKGIEDSFVSTPEAVKGMLKQEDVDDIVNFIQENKPSNTGFRSEIYKMGDRAIKVPKEKVYSSIFEEQFAKGQNLKEYVALEKIQEIDSAIAANPISLIRNRDSYYLVEELIKGEHPKGKVLTNGHLANLFRKFLNLDKNCIYNCDLQSGNIFLLDDVKTKLIDFGSFTFIDNQGAIIGSDSMPNEIFKNEFGKLTSSAPSERFLRTFIHDNHLDVKNLADNPYIKAPSNATNFEFRTIYPHLLDNNEENPLGFFRNYLKLKAHHYHAKFKEFLKNLSFDGISEHEFPMEKINVAKSDLNKAINYEGMVRQVLSNPTDDVVKVELAKLQLRTFLNLGDSLGSPVQNPKKLQAAYNQLISTLEEGIENSQGDKKEYFIQTLESFKSRFKDYAFESGQVDIPDNENLIKVLFKQVKNQAEAVAEATPETVAETIKENSENIKQASKGFNKKIGIIVAAAVAIAAIVTAIIIKVRKKALNAAPAINNIDTVAAQNIRMLKKAPDVYDKFTKM